MSGFTSLACVVTACLGAAGHGFSTRFRQHPATRPHSCPCMASYSPTPSFTASQARDKQYPKKPSPAAVKRAQPRWEHVGVNRGLGLTVLKQKTMYNDFSFGFLGLVNPYKPLYIGFEGLFLRQRTPQKRLLGWSTP